MCWVPSLLSSLRYGVSACFHQAFTVPSFRSLISPSLLAHHQISFPVAHLSCSHRPVLRPQSLCRNCTGFQLRFAGPAALTFGGNLSPLCELALQHLVTMATNLQISSTKVGVRYEDSDGLLRIVRNKYIDSSTLPNAAILKGWVSRALRTTPLTIVIQVGSDLVPAFLTTPLRASISIQGRFLGS